MGEVEEVEEVEEESTSVGDALVKVLLRSDKELKGFHRRNLALNSDIQSGKKSRLNELEKMQLYAEVVVLKTFLKDNPSHVRNARTGKRVNGKLVKQNKTDLVTQKHLLTHCWGVGENLSRSIEKEIDHRAIDRGISCNLTRSVLMTSMIVEEEDKVKTVIDNQEVCDQVFTTKRLFCNNWVLLNHNVFN